MSSTMVYREPHKAPDPVIIEPDKRKIKIEVDGQ
jgi:hypothetical protein